MVKQGVIGFSLIIIATLCYYIPTMVASSKGIDIKSIPLDYYNHHIWRTSGAFLLTAIYAFCFFIMVPEKMLILKILSCHLFLMETYSFADHVISMFYIKGGFNLNQIITILAFFSGSLIFFSYRAFKTPETQAFNANKAYIVSFRPKNILGIINYIWNHSGHKAIYQNGKIYSFKRSTGRLEERKIKDQYFVKEGVFLSETRKNENIKEIIGERYNVFSFNCNHLAEYAKRH